MQKFQEFGGYSRSPAKGQISLTEAKFLTMHCGMAVRVNESKSGSRETN